MKIAGFYVRNSTQGQKEDKTIESQIAEIEEKVKQDGNIIGQNFKFVDEAWSGELLARPALDTLRDAIKNKSFEVLYLYDLGRLSRNFLNQLILKDEIRESGIQIISLHDINGETPEQLLAQNVMGLFHDYERIKIAERFRRGKLYKAKSGILFGWQAPYGYQYIKGKEKGQGNFVIIPKEADTIRKIFTWIGIEGLTIRQVIKRLYEQQYYPRESKNKYWSTSTLSKRLRDETYIGTTYYNKTLSIAPEKPFKNEKYKHIKKSSRTLKEKEEWFPIKVPEILERGLFDAVQKQLVLNDMLAVRNKKNNYLLAGFMYCTCSCTRAGEGVSGTTNLYYRCTDRVKRFPLPKECHNRGVNSVVLDSLVWDEITSLLTDPKLIQAQYERWMKKQTEPADYIINEKNNLENSLRKLEEQEKRYIKAYGEEIITLDQFKDQIGEMKLQKTQIQGRLLKLGATAPQQRELIKLPDLDMVCGKMSTVLQKKTFEEKRFIVKRLLEKVTTDGTTAIIKGYIPLQLTEDTNINVGFKTEYRNCGAAECGKINTFQCAPQETGSICGQLSLCNY